MLNRRELLKTSALVGGGLVLGSVPVFGAIAQEKPKEFKVGDWVFLRKGICEGYPNMLGQIIPSNHHSRGWLVKFGNENQEDYWKYRYPWWVETRDIEPLEKGMDVIINFPFMHKLVNYGPSKAKLSTGKIYNIGNSELFHYYWYSDKGEVNFEGNGIRISSFAQPYQIERA